MLVGIIADTHDRLEKIEKAVRFFNSQKLDYILHAGDYIAPFTAKVFSKIRVPMIGIFGDNDGERRGLLEKYKPFAEIYEPPYFFELKGYKIALLHEAKDMDRLIKEYRVVVYAHTHQPEIKHFGNHVRINPGECCGYLTGKSTVATVDLKTLKVSLTEL